MDGQGAARVPAASADAAEAAGADVGGLDDEREAEGAHAVRDDVQSDVAQELAGSEGTA